MRMPPKKACTVFGDYPMIGFLSIFYAATDSPLGIWYKQERTGEIRRSLDEDKSAALEIFTDANIFHTYITAPCPPFASLGIKLPYLNIILKNMDMNFALTVQIRDELCKRRFLFSSSFRTQRVKSLCANIPVSLEKDWNELTLDLATLTRRAYGTTYEETVRIQIHANCRLRMIYFSAAPLETAQAVEMLKNIMAADVKEAKTPSKPGSHCGPPIIPETAPTTTVENESPKIEGCIEKTLSWREKFAKYKVKAAISETGKLDVKIPEVQSPVQTKSCPQMEFDIEAEMRSIIDSELLNFDLEREADSLNGNKIVRYLEPSTENENPVEEIPGMNSTDGESLIEESEVNDTALSEIPTKPAEDEAQILLEKEQREEMKEISPAQIPRRNLKPFRWPLDALTHGLTKIEKHRYEPKIVGRMASEKSELAGSNWKNHPANPAAISNGNETEQEPRPSTAEVTMKDLDDQLLELESVLSGMMDSPPSKVKASASITQLQQLPESSKIVDIRTRLDAMKRHLVNLEEAFEQKLVAAKTSDSLEEVVNIPAKITPAPAPPSGLLRSSSSVKVLKQKLSVRFATIQEEEEPEENQQQIVKAEPVHSEEQSNNLVERKSTAQLCLNSILSIVSSLSLSGFPNPILK